MEDFFIINLQKQNFAQQTILEYWLQHYAPMAPRQIITKLTLAARSYQLELPVADRTLYRAAVSYTSLSGWQRWQLRRQFLKCIAAGNLATACSVGRESGGESINI